MFDNMWLASNEKAFQRKKNQILIEEINTTVLIAPLATVLLCIFFDSVEANKSNNSWTSI